MCGICVYAKRQDCTKSWRQSCALAGQVSKDPRGFLVGKWVEWLEGEGRFFFVFGGVRLWGPYHKPEWFEGRFIFCVRVIINHTFIAVMIYRLPLGTSHPKQIDCLYEMGTHETFPFSLKAKWLGGRMLHPTDGNGKWLKWKFLATLRTCVIVGKHPLHVVKQWKQQNKVDE